MSDYRKEQIDAAYRKIHEEKRRREADPENLKVGEVINLCGIVNYQVTERAGKEVFISAILKRGELGNAFALDWDTPFKKVEK